MPLIGFSTGAIALGNFDRALLLLRSTSMTALELSALRLSELPSLIAALPRLDLTKYEYVSFHAPSRFLPIEEDSVVQLLQSVPTAWPIIVHPDTIHDSTKWEPFGRQLAIENMDRRKSFGRSADELKHWFDLLPQARLCLDLAHVHQFDRTMTEAYRILRSFGDRVCQLHVSELDSAGHHYPLSLGSMRAFAEVKSMVPADAAIILESLSPNKDGDDLLQAAWIELEAQRACLALQRDEPYDSWFNSNRSCALLNQAVLA
jgi:hypothetical protein